MSEQPQFPNFNDQQRSNNQKPKKNFSWLFYAILFFFIGLLLFPSDKFGSGKDISYTKLVKYIEEDLIESLSVSDENTVKATVRKEKEIIVFGPTTQEKSLFNPSERTVTSQIGSTDEFVKLMDKINAERLEKGLPIIDVKYEKSSNWWYILANIFPILFIVFLFMMMSRGLGNIGSGGGIFGVGRAQAQVFNGDKKDKITFKDVAGLQGAKQEVEEIVHFLRNPKKYTNLGGKIPKGALLVGPPGTGKTLLAKAVAGEANVPFFTMSGSDFVEMFVGVGASRVRDLFRQAKEKAPCIIFIDEIDAVGRSRGRNSMISSNDERESTLNQLLTEMDGFGTNSGVIILAATNRADVLDSALLRAGRFDRQIHVDLPDLQERREIFEVHMRRLKLDRNVEINFLAKQTPGFSGADIANVCNEAALVAARKDHRFVGKQDFMDAVDRIVGGLERKTKIVTEDEKRSIAYHEAGHATISWMLRWANPLVKVSIVPRGMSLGAAWYLPEERQLTNKDHILDELCSLLGGRAAEELFLNQVSTGALNDLERATKQSYAMVAFYGMSEKIKNISYYDSTGRNDYSFTRPYSEHTAELIDKEVANIISEQMKRAKSILKQYTNEHHKLADLLVEKEIITHEDVERILGPRPWKSRGDEIIADNDAAKNKTQNADNQKNNTPKKNTPKKNNAKKAAPQKANPPKTFEFFADDAEVQPVEANEEQVAQANSPASTEKKPTKKRNYSRKKKTTKAESQPNADQA